MKINKSRRPRIGPLKLAFDSNFADQFEERFATLKTLRTGFEKKSVLPHAAHKPAHTRGSFEKNYRQAKLFQPISAGKPGNPPANHNHLLALTHRLPLKRLRK